MMYVDWDHPHFSLLSSVLYIAATDHASMQELDMQEPNQKQNIFPLPKQHLTYRN